MGTTRPYKHARNRLRRAATALALAGAAALSLAASAPASAVSFEIKGRGFGHGIGLSQYGAYGFAREGKTAGEIVRHYYTGVRLGEAPSKRINVLITTGAGSARVSHATQGCGRKLSATKGYRVVLRGGQVRLRSGGAPVASCGRRAVVSGPGGVRVAGHGTYRGRSIFRRAGGSLDVINRLGLGPYLQSVVPREMPASWHLQALRAQAIVARSYALATSVNGNGFDVYDDTRSQVYGGRSAEHPATNRAVRSTGDRVALHRGKVAVTYFYSTSGGRTEAIENAWPGASPAPYLKSVRDPFDSISPVHRWSLTLSRARLEELLGSWVRGRLRNVRVLTTGDSPRVIRARIVGSAGNRTVSGPDLHTRLGLRSTWFRFLRS